MQNVQIEFDRTSLYREEIYTDLKVGTIHMFTPVNADGTVDENRQVTFAGETQIMTPNGPVPISCTIEAATLAEAMDNFSEAVNATVEKLIAEAREMQREAAGRIVTPDEASGGKIIF